jgi:hypothetical protein
MSLNKGVNGDEARRGYFGKLPGLQIGGGALCGLIRSRELPRPST